MRDPRIDMIHNLLDSAERGLELGLSDYAITRLRGWIGLARAELQLRPLPADYADFAARRIDQLEETIGEGAFN